MLDLHADHLDLARSILRTHLPNARAWAYGSRVQGRAKRYSDLDLAIRSNAELGLEEIFTLKDAFSESDLPIRVDVPDLHSVSPEFLAVIRDEFVPVV